MAVEPRFTLEQRTCPTFQYAYNGIVFDETNVSREMRLGAVDSIPVVCPVRRCPVSANLPHPHPGTG